MVQDFVDGHSCVLPTAEGLDIVLEMCELAQNIAGIMELAEEVSCFVFSSFHFWASSSLKLFDHLESSRYHGWNSKCYYDILCILLS